MIAIQLATLAGLRVNAVRHAERLSDLGVDILVDRQDPARAVEITRNVTKGGFRFALGTVGKETATQLQESLQNSPDGRQAHLVGLTGLPKTNWKSVKYHSVSIKVFHDVPAVVDQAVRWLEELLVGKILQAPEVEIADGGLKSINQALDRLRKDTISGKRLIIEVGAGKTAIPNGVALPDGTNTPSGTPKDLTYADKLNQDPSRIKIA